jgi:hypothetical protein
VELEAQWPLYHSLISSLLSGTIMPDTPCSPGKPKHSPSQGRDLMLPLLKEKASAAAPPTQQPLPTWDPRRLSLRRGLSMPQPGEPRGPSMKTALRMHFGSDLFMQIKHNFTFAQTLLMNAYTAPHWQSEHQVPAVHQQSPW